MRLVRSGDWHDMPWKNGGGTTSEIAAERDGDVILWRLSTAIVDRDGPYSTFPGLMRISTVIVGNGTILQDPCSGSRVYIPPLTPTLLDGTIPWDAHLTDGSIRHFNLFYDPDRLGASVEVLKIAGRQVFNPQHDIVFCLSGAVRIGEVVLSPFDCLIWPSGAVDGRATLLHVSLKVLW